MTRTPFILGTALFCVAATIVAIQVMPSAESPEEALLAEADTLLSKQSRVNSPDSATPASTTRTSRSQDRTDGMNISLESSTLSNVGADKRVRIGGILSLVQRKSGEKLAQLSETYSLTRRQREAIYPLIVAHDTQSHPAMLVGGKPLPILPAGRTLDDSIYAELNPDQRDLLTGEALERDAWWTEVASQLQDDLDQSLSEGGGVAPPAGTNGSVAPGIVPSSGPAQGDGQASEHTGGNLFDLLNGN